MKYLKSVATIELAQDRCNGCGRCVEVCPRAVFGLNARKAELLDRDGCIECGACAKNCESNAITVQSGVGCATALLYAKRTGKAPCCC